MTAPEGEGAGAEGGAHGAVCTRGWLVDMHGGTGGGCMGGKQLHLRWGPPLLQSMVGIAGGAGAAFGGLLAGLGGMEWSMTHGGT
jgi:hypothetical protein